MAERQWTAAQAAAIGETDKTLLVSAAAGSGKTAVLTERILRALTDPVHPAELSRMLIVTFTRAAAAEMRDRIAKNLSAAMQGKRSPHLERQLLLLPGAYICTIDSFCLDLVRAHASLLGISPAFRLSDQAETRLLHCSCMERLVEDGYAGALGEEISAADFTALAECLSGSRDDKALPELLLSLYEKTRGFARGTHTVSDAAADLHAAVGQPPFATPWGRFLRDKAKATVASLLARYDALLPLIAEEEAVSKAYLAPLQGDREGLAALHAALSGDYSAARESILSLAFARLGSLKAEFASEVSESAKALRKLCKDSIADLRNRFFSYTEKNWQTFLPLLADRVACLGRLLACFEERVMAEKRRRTLCDFGDIEHFALSLLVDELGEPTALAAEVRAAYDQVYIDEYQDVNEVQHSIFRALSGERNRFMVGDVKQSIYGFRGAQPEIFAAVRAESPPLSESGDLPRASVSLSANFRSERNILQFVNMVFGRLMEAVGDRIGYRPEEDRLIPGRGEDTPSGPSVTLALFQKEKAPPGEETEDAESPADNAAREEDEGEDTTPDPEAKWVAARIRALLSEKNAEDKEIEPGDIAILARSSAALVRFAYALEEQGIRAELPAKKGFFRNPEILLALSLLNVIDNPRRDVHLAAVLRSPIYGFTMDELVRIRRAADETESGKGASLYEALCLAEAAAPQDPKLARFFAELRDFRAAAECTSVDRLIREVYRRTGLLSIAGNDRTGDPSARRANLMLLYDYARRFESSSFCGLYSFLAYINEAIERGQSIEESGKLGTRRDTVHLMTVHQSKGLEFPICFLVDCGHRFNRDDTKSPLLFDRELGTALCLQDESGLALLRNPVYRAISERIGDKATEEEMRVLYVALTRPRTRLLVTATLTDVSAALAKGEERRRFFGTDAVYSCASYADMLLATLSPDPCFTLLTPDLTENRGACVVKIEKAEEESAPREDEDALYTLFSRRFSFAYPYRYATELPSKLSVSRLSPTVLDGSEEEEHIPTLRAWTSSAEEAEAEEYISENRLPVFLGGERNTAAEAGTATHLFMQFCDFVRLLREGGEAERDRLVTQRFLSAEDAALVRMDEIEKFRRSALVRELTADGGRLYRELRFNVRLPAAALTSDPERRAAFAKESVLVQGVMDGVLVREDGSVFLFDYKTDRLTYAERRDPRLAAEKLLARHSTQLGYYALAAREIFGRAPDRVAIYSLALGDTIDLSLPTSGEES